VGGRVVPRGGELVRDGMSLPTAGDCSAEAEATVGVAEDECLSEAAEVGGSDQVVDVHDTEMRDGEKEPAACEADSDWGLVGRVSGRAGGELARTAGAGGLVAGDDDEPEAGRLGGLGGRAAGGRGAGQGGVAAEGMAGAAGGAGAARNIWTLFPVLLGRRTACSELLPAAASLSRSLSVRPPSERGTGESALCESASAVAVLVRDRGLSSSARMAASSSASAGDLGRPSVRRTRNGE